MATHTVPSHQPAAGHEGHAHSHGGPRQYAYVLGALLVLTVITVAASRIHFGSVAMNLAIAGLIASIKATLVALYFMHLRHDNPVNSMILGTAVFFVGLLFTICLIDFDSRDQIMPASYKLPAGMVTPEFVKGHKAGEHAPGSHGEGTPAVPNLPKGNAAGNNAVGQPAAH